MEKMSTFSKSALKTWFSYAIALLLLFCMAYGCFRVALGDFYYLSDSKTFVCSDCLRRGHAQLYTKNSGGGVIRVYFCEIHPKEKGKKVYRPKYFDVFDEPSIIGSLMFVVFPALFSGYLLISFIKPKRLQVDSAAATQWYRSCRKSAEQGNAGAQCHLGVMYAIGDGVLKDSTEAAKWFRKSAERGNATAQGSLGSAYYVGNGVIKDIVQAHAWYNNASANGDERVRELMGFIEKQMTPEQKTEAMKLSREILDRIEAKKK
jgi:TPR repeat protein